MKRRELIGVLADDLRAVEMIRLRMADIDQQLSDPPREAGDALQHLAEASAGIAFTLRDIAERDDVDIVSITLPPRKA